MMGTEHVNSIKESLENIAVGNYYHCPQCGTFGDWENARNAKFDEDADSCDEPEYVCPECGCEDVYDMTMYDYFEDSVYGIEYRVDSKDADTINSVRVCVAYGGPNIYIDTADAKVKCAWWFDYCEADISDDVCKEINEVFEEFWNA